MKIRKKNLFVDAPDEKYFYFPDGTSAKNLLELVYRLNHVDNKTFSRHANKKTNDFANWAGNVFKQKKLAKKIINQNKKNTQKIILKEFINNL